MSGSYVWILLFVTLQFDITLWNETQLHDKYPEVKKEKKERETLAHWSCSAAGGKST